MHARSALAALLVAALATAAAAVGPPPPSAPAATTGNAAPAVSTRDEIARELAAAQAQLAAVEAAGAEGGAPHGTPASEISDRGTLARQLVAMYQQQQDTLERADAAQAQRTAAERASREWSGFATPPPHSILLIDGIRDSIDAAEARLVAAAGRRALLDRFGADIEAKLKASQAAARQASEAADAAAGTPASARRDWERDLALLRARVDVATQGLIQIALRGVREETASAEAARDLARRQLAAAGRGATLTPEERARIDVEIDERRRATEAEIKRATRAAAAAIGARERADAELARLKAAPPTADDAGRADRELAVSLDAALERERAAAASLRADSLKDHLMVLAGERLAWDARSESLRTQDPVSARAAYERLGQSLATLRTRRQYLDQELVSVGQRIGEYERKLRTAAGAEEEHARRMVEVLRARETEIRGALRNGEPLERLLDRFREDLEGKRGTSFVDEARDAAAAVVLQARRAWNYEMFTVDDTFETADGRKLSVSRGVTVGKTVGAVLIVVVGFWLVRAIMRRTERILVARGRVTPQSAALLRNWVLLAVMCVLVVFALATASIPLTVFAFLGGALAIAAGFGLQTLLKNLVSGVILLGERPMRLGDLVEVDGTRGRVTQIGIRASTILTGDGIESMIPNSAFLEGKLTNWTYTSPQTRQTIVVGVAYGTPLRQAADVLAGVLARHGLVRKDPLPQVYLDEYADSAIRFALTYWVDMTPENDARRVKSDLLHMIDTAFAEAGIRMPFPQLDVHLDRGAAAP